MCFIKGGSQNPPFLLKIFMEILQEKIAAIIEPSLTSQGYSLVQVRLIEAGRRTLQIMAERADGKNMTVEDCANISHDIGALLDVEDPIKGEYNLEVSSPGIDRPLIKLNDYEKYNGFDAKIETKLPVEARKRFKGKLRGVEGDNILIEIDAKTTAKVPLNLVKAAKLVLTDELIKLATSGKINH